MYEASEAPREESERIQLLLDEVRELLPRPAWQRVEELIQRLVALYGEGLKRLLDEARGCGADGRLSERLADDELLSSLLLLHDLHPLDAGARVRRAIERLGPYLARRGARVELIGIDGGLIRVRLSSGGGCGADSLKEIVRRAMEDAAPDLDGVEVEEPSVPLVALRTSGARP